MFDRVKEEIIELIDAKYALEFKRLVRMYNIEYVALQSLI